MLLKFAILIVMAIGLAGTLSQRFWGTGVIFLGAIIYSTLSGVHQWPTWVLGIMTTLLLLSEFGGRMIRHYLARNTKLTPVFCVNTISGSLAGIVVAEALLGSILGGILWEILIGTPLSSEWNDIKEILLVLIGIAMMRFIFGLTMLAVVVSWIFI